MARDRKYIQISEKAGSLTSSIYKNEKITGEYDFVTDPIIIASIGKDTDIQNIYLCENIKNKPKPITCGCNPFMVYTVGIIMDCCYKKEQGKPIPISCKEFRCENLEHFENVDASKIKDYIQILRDDKKIQKNEGKIGNPSYKNIWKLLVTQFSAYAVTLMGFVITSIIKG